MLKYSNGTIVNVWQNTSAFNGSQSVSGSFTTPATVASFQVGTAVTLDKGYLEFSEVTLTAYSAALPITAGDTYQFTGQVAGALAAPLGQGGRIVAAYTNVDGQSAGEDLLWQNPTNFNGTVPVQQTFTANAGAVTLRLALTAALDAGHLDFGDFALQRLAAGDVIRRSTYMLAGTAVAVRVTGDPDGNDGLHYLYSDHLGSASAIQNSDGRAPIITRYLPFGGYRAGSGTNEVTDRGFTGQSENMSLGLYYYQARFYVPGIGRFASADSIVPDLTNPQSYNRYTYVLNSPLKYTDPSGHCFVFAGLDTLACAAAWAAVASLTVVAADAATPNSNMIADATQGLVDLTYQASKGLKNAWNGFTSFVSGNERQNTAAGMVSSIQALLGGQVGGTPNDPHDDKDYSNSGVRSILPDTLKNRLQSIFDNVNFAPEAHQCDICARQVRSAFSENGINADIIRIRFPRAQGLWVEHNGQMIQISANDSHYFTLSDGMVYDSLTGSQGMPLKQYLARYFQPLAEDWFLSPELTLLLP